MDRPNKTLEISRNAAEDKNNNYHNTQYIFTLINNP
jgi:hypothetical protein